MGVLRKTCSKCSTTYPATPKHFHRSARTKDGLLGRCVRCIRAAQATYYSRYREKILARVKAWNLLHPGRASARSRTYYANHKATHKARVVAWGTANPDAIRSKGKRYRKAHPERLRAKNQNRRARFLAAPGTFSAADVARQLKKQSTRCYWCRNPLTKYHVDHKIALARGGTNYPSNLVCACPRCNSLKGTLTPGAFRAKLRRIQCPPTTSDVPTVMSSSVSAPSESETPTRNPPAPNVAFQPIRSSHRCRRSTTPR